MSKEIGKELEKKAVMPTLRKMRVGEIIEFSLRQLNSVRSCTSTVGAIERMKFTTYIDRDNYVVVVKRIS